MMDWNADHAGFVIAAYALSLAFVAGLIIYVFNRDARARKRLAHFKRQKSDG
jgi:heme exporter protein CcmD